MNLPYLPFSELEPIKQPHPQGLLSYWDKRPSGRSCQSNISIMHAHSNSFSVENSGTRLYLLLLYFGTGMPLKPQKLFSRRRSVFSNLILGHVLCFQNFISGQGYKIFSGSHIPVAFLQIRFSGTATPVL